MGVGRGTVYLLGAGASMAAGAPSLNRYLDLDAAKRSPEADFARVQEFVSRLGPDPNRSGIEAAWIACEDGIRSAKPVAGVPIPDLRKVQRSIVAVHHSVLESLHREVSGMFTHLGMPLETDSEFTPEVINVVRRFLRAPRHWLDTEITPQLTRGKRRLARTVFKHAVAGDGFDDDQHLSPAVEATARALESEYHIATDAARTAADQLWRNHLTKPTSGHEWSRRRGFEARLDSLDRFGEAGRVLRTPVEPADEFATKAFWVEALWRAHLCATARPMLENLAGFFDTHYSLVARLGARDAVVTTNYDLFFELAWELSPRPIRRPVTALDWGTDFYVHFDDDHMPLFRAGTADTARRLKAENVGHALRSSSPPRWTPYLKVHGSINWAMCPAYTHLFMVHLKPWRTPGTTRRLCDCTVVGSRRRSSTLVIVPPHEYKDYAFPVLANIAGATRITLARAARIDIIGHSMAEGDSHLRNIISQAMLDRGGEPWDVHLIAGPSPDQSTVDGVGRLFNSTLTVHEKYAEDYLRVGWRMGPKAVE